MEESGGVFGGRRSKVEGQERGKKKADIGERRKEERSPSKVRQ